MSDDQTRFSPVVTERVPSGSWFAEIFPMPGPEEVADIKNGTRRDRYGHNWLVLLTHAFEAQAWQERPPGSGQWHMVTDLLPPIFGQTLPHGSRRLTGVFDQSGRMVVAYEHNQLVYLTRWDVETQQYVQNVTFPGTNPTLTTDLHAGIPVADSDVWIFYQPPGDLTQIHSRIQRDLYLTVYTVWNGDQELILDRAQVSIQLQLLVSDTLGLPLRLESGELAVLAGPYYPFRVQDAVALDARPSRGIYEETTLVRAVEDHVLLSGAPLNPDGLSGEPLRVQLPRLPLGESNAPMLDATTRFKGDAEGSYQPIYSSACEHGPSDQVIDLDAWGIATPVLDGPTLLLERELNFDVIVQSENLLQQGRYGIRGLSVSFRTQWAITRTSVSQEGDILAPAVMYNHYYTDDNPPEMVCYPEETWQAGARTLVVEVAQSRTELTAANQALQWHEVWRTTEGPQQGVHEYSFYADLSLLTSERYPFVSVRIRTVENTGNNSTHVYLLSGWVVQLDMLSNAYISDTLQRTVQDAVMLDVRPTIGRYEDNVRKYAVQDHVALDAEPAVGQYELYIGANPHVQDHVTLDVEPVIGVYREV